MKYLIVDNNVDAIAPITREIDRRGQAHERIALASLDASAATFPTADCILFCLSDPATISTDTFSRYRDTAPHLPWIVLSDLASTDVSMAFLNAGAALYLPLTASPPDMLDLVEQRYLPAPDRDRDGRTVAVCSDIIGESEAVQRVVGVVGKVARTDSTVLISGESGTGKELIARAIHEGSPRVKGRLVILNCGAIPGELLESELFGHEKGAFTGAHRTRMGRFELADGGTLFLDEIGDMRADLQVKLLRTLQEKTIERVGGNRSIPVDVRIIGATNKDLTAAISDGTFREDLYYRLNVIPIHVPPLRERKTDIPLLVDFFQKRLAERMGEPVKPLTPDAMATLQAYAWPGNIRELENLMERLGVLVDSDTIRSEDLPDVISGMPSVREGTDQISELLDSGLGFNDVVDLLQKRLILAALKQTGWVKAKAAEKLQMNRTTLVEKIKKLKIEAACADRPVF